MGKMKKVVCVDASNSELIAGEVYTVKQDPDSDNYYIVYDENKKEIGFWLKTRFEDVDELSTPVQELSTPAHYDNSNGTLYKVAQERGWNPYLFDIVKRLERAEKKGEFKTDLEKSINVIKLWLKERDALDAIK